MIRTLGGTSLACLSLLALVSSPAAQAEGEAVEAEKPDTYFSVTDGQAAIVATCRATATPGADQTSVSCTVDDVPYVLEVFYGTDNPDTPEDERIVLVYQDLGTITLPGQTAAAVWQGADTTPSRVCTRATAMFNQSSGPPIVVTDEDCRTIYG